MQLDKLTHQRILYSYLNWGYGHLSRSIGVVRKLLAQENEVVIAAPQRDFEIIRGYFPDAQLIDFPAYPFTFSGTGNFTKDLWNSRKKLIEFMREEKIFVEELVKNKQIDIVISDHRYGFRSAFVPSIFITHQVNLAVNWWQFPAQLLHHQLIRQFNRLWVMDDEQHSMAGKLSKSSFKNTDYIGHFSRFEQSDISKELIIGIVNGPFPYNQQLLQQLVLNQEIDLIISPISHSDSRVRTFNNWQEADEIIYKAKKIYAYCGYSTLLDIHVLACESHLIPTPGQTEQDYLHQLHSK
ncbi:MAG TPA: hypothetical protein VKZ44_02360 [Taishania sp.]|nr:hypothetical protein [Taishania sp.]